MLLLFVPFLQFSGLVVVVDPQSGRERQRERAHANAAGDYCPIDLMVRAFGVLLEMVE